MGISSENPKSLCDTVHGAACSTFILLSSVISVFSRTSHICSDLISVNNLSSPLPLIMDCFIQVEVGIIHDPSSIIWPNPESKENVFVSLALD